MNKLSTFLIFILFVICGHTRAQEAVDNPKLDHNIFIEKISNSQTLFFNEVIKKYDDYLIDNPEDILILIEKCKFVEFAQYDEYGEYNLNQELFDSLSNDLFNRYPYHPEVLIYQTTQYWEEDLQEVFKKVKKSIKDNNHHWSNKNLGIIYFEMAKQDYYDEKFKQAYNNADIAIDHDEKLKSLIEYAKILIAVDKKDEALKALNSGKDTSKHTWEINQKAELLLELKDYNNALKLYKTINEIDSSYNNNLETAKIMEGINKFNEARTYLLKDTAMLWDKTKAYFNLFSHDLKYQSANTALLSYNKYRDLGFSKDALAIYRLKLFFKYPLLSWKLRDFLGLLTLVLLLAVLIIIPSIWILPLHFISHRWKLYSAESAKITLWGLKSFWWVSAGYFIASFAASLVSPEYLNSIITWTDFYDGYTTEQQALSALIFMITYAVITFFMLYKINLSVLLYKYWSFWKCFGITAGLFVAYKFASIIYIQIGMIFFDVKLSDISFIPQILLSSTDEIKALISEYGIGIGCLTVGVLVPIYEEIIFRGVILDACKRYINFRWANIIQATLFATIHDDLYLFPVFFGFGMLAGLLKEKSGGLLSGISFHIVNNLLALLVIALRG
jgi:membrane protease YdiL (CAAX protease family)/predicted negative regulator of RcsB-dependent stress response